MHVSEGEVRQDGQGGLYAHYVLFVLVIVFVFNFIDRNILAILSQDIQADLGIGDATGGRVHAHIIRTTKPCPEGGSGMHYHEVDFQMVMVLKGRSRVWFEGEGEVEFEEGDCWIQPPGIKHNVLYYSEDYELLELTLPEKYETVQVE